MKKNLDPHPCPYLECWTEHDVERLGQDEYVAQDGAQLTSRRIS